MECFCFLAFNASKQIYPHDQQSCTFCIVWYVLVLCGTVLYGVVLHGMVLYCMVLCGIVLYCIAWYCMVLYCMVWYCIVWFCGTGSAGDHPPMSHIDKSAYLREKEEADEVYQRLLKQTSGAFTTKSHTTHPVTVPSQGQLDTALCVCGMGGGCACMCVGVGGGSCCCWGGGGGGNAYEDLPVCIFLWLSIFPFLSGSSGLCPDKRVQKLTEYEFQTL